MDSNGPLFELDRAQMTALLDELDDRLEARGIAASLYLVGGAAMTLAYGREGFESPRLHHEKLQVSLRFPSFQGRRRRPCHQLCLPGAAARRSASHCRRSASHFSAISTGRWCPQSV